MVTPTTLTGGATPGLHGGMRVAIAQVASSIDPEPNLALVSDYASRAADSGARIVVFPEATMASFATASGPLAQPLDGAWPQAVRAIAREAGIVVVVGLFEAQPGGLPWNTLLVTGPGVEETTYRKLHLFDAWGFAESDHIAPGAEPATVTVDGVVFGLAICYDVRFPALFQHYGRLGADVVLVPASWANGADKVDQWRTLCRARAMDSTCYVIGAGQADPATAGYGVRPGAPTGVGHSVVVDPLGAVVAEAGGAPELVVVDLDTDAVADARRRVPVLANARFVCALPTPG